LRGGVAAPHKSADKNPVVNTGGLAVDLVSRSVMLDGKRIALTRKEYRLLHVLASHVGLVVTHNQLIKEIWGNSSPDNIQHLRMLVRKVRQKLEDDPSQPKLLLSESGVGYRLERIAPTAPATPKK
jgi:two-component system KDP operon response regulator KdpE